MATFAIEDIRRLNGMLAEVELVAARPAYVELIHRLRHAGIPVSDRRAVKLQRLMAASALLCGRLEVHTTDLWVLRYIWDAEDQQEVLDSIVQDAIDKSRASQAGRRASAIARRGRARCREPGGRSAADRRPACQGSHSDYGTKLLEGPPGTAGRPMPLGGKTRSSGRSGTSNSMQLWQQLEAAA